MPVYDEAAATHRERDTRWSDTETRGGQRERETWWSERERLAVGCTAKLS